MILFNKAPMLFLVAMVSVLVFISPVIVLAEKYRLEIKPDETIWINTEATATATTDDPAVDQVIFEWIDPHGTTRKTTTDIEVPFQDSFELDELGEWKVIATFGEGIKKIVIIRVVVTVIPELGTIVGITAFFAALAAFAIRKHLISMPPA